MFLNRNAPFRQNRDWFDVSESCFDEIWPVSTLQHPVWSKHSEFRQNEACFDISESCFDETWPVSTL